MSIKRKWLRVVMLLMMGVASFVGAKMNPQEIEDVLHIMNETKVEFTIPDENDKGDGKETPNEDELTPSEQHLDHRNEHL